MSGANNSVVLRCLFRDTTWRDSFEVALSLSWRNALRYLSRREKQLSETREVVSAH